ncbi:MAG: hypothetical protein OXN86_10985 [Chloroflexota bacterium]|nr:hypothetical protein [Chloroflexota bacterium]MDE2893015.1 hypothetical protein [Chloroflexota bacterium]
MSVMTPILRIRKVLRSIGASPEQADEFADAMNDYPGRRELQLMLDEVFARWFNRIVFSVIVIVGLAVAIIVAVD